MSIDRIKESIQDHIQDQIDDIHKDRKLCGEKHTAKLEELSKKFDNLQNSSNILNQEIKSIVQLRNKLNSLVWKIVTAVLIFLAVAYTEQNFKKNSVEKKIDSLQQSIESMKVNTPTTATTNTKTP